MTTKYVLNSGRALVYPELGRKFFAEILHGLGTNPKILLCYFSRPREQWDTLSAARNNFADVIPAGITPSFTLAMPDTFATQIRECDVVYILGGDDHLLQYWLRQFDLPKLWIGKVVAGSSAGSDALVTSFWTCDWRKSMNGLGILPIKFLPHYQSEYGAQDPRGPIDWEQARKELEAFGDTSLPVYALKEGEFCVLQK